jgi:hypothetical protein
VVPRCGVSIGDGIDFLGSDELDWWCSGDGKTMATDGEAMNLRLVFGSVVGMLTTMLYSGGARRGSSGSAVQG